ncbi:hypothetical protein I3842_15G068400 [Carya illinoinensis]|uniref:Uncharacterized protein n=1 Tax=Carya illinoinensis TaxID=32201 RepID=A0A922ABY7_CARIL|nr:hypothetical protein I3842_15G068400 [Carya illinoinensis]
MASYVKLCDHSVLSLVTRISVKTSRKVSVRF